MSGLAGMLLGAIAGVWHARRRGGGRLDMLHHAAVYGIALGIAGFLVALLVARLG